MKAFKLALGVAFGTAVIAGSAQAAVITGSLVPPAPPFTLLDLGASGTTGFVSNAPITLSGETITFGGGAPPAGLYYGSPGPGVALSPFNGTGLPQRNYLAAEPGGNVTIAFASPQTAFDLLWGSVDTYNSVTFTAGSTVISGTDIASAVSGINFGTSNAAVEISGLTPFTTLTASSTQSAFEFVPGTPTPAPEPASLALLGTGLLGLGLARRRKAN